MIDGKFYLDGAFYNNLPISMVVRKGIHNIIAIRTNSLGITQKKDLAEQNIVYIKPNESLGRVLDFSNARARNNLQLGYYDAYKTIKGLGGKKYYITLMKDERFFFDFLQTISEEKVIRAGANLGIGDMPYRRILFEHIIPKLANLFELKKGSTYEDIILAVIEFLAEEQGIEKFKFYTFAEIWHEVQIAYKLNPVKGDSDELKKLPAFLKQGAVLTKNVKRVMLREIVYGMLEEKLMQD
jgi:NTE family protein